MREWERTKPFVSVDLWQSRSAEENVNENENENNNINSMLTGKRGILFNIRWARFTLACCIEKQKAAIMIRLAS